MFLHEVLRIRHTFRLLLHVPGIRILTCPVPPSLLSLSIYSKLPAIPGGPTGVARAGREQMA